jgi:hypothetical protein
MPIPLPPILSAMPQAWHVRLEIARAIQTLVGQEERPPLPSIEAWAVGLDDELIKQCVRDSRQELLLLLRSNGIIKAAVDDPQHPGWPAGTPDGKGGWFRPKDQVLAAADEYGSSPPGIGHNQGPPPDEPPAIPETKPATAKALNSFLKAAAYRLAAAGAAARARFQDSRRVATGCAESPARLQFTPYRRANIRTARRISGQYDRWVGKPGSHPDAEALADHDLVSDEKLQV